MVFCVLVFPLFLLFFLLSFCFVVWRGGGQRRGEGLVTVLGRAVELIDGKGGFTFDKIENSNKCHLLVLKGSGVSLGGLKG